MKPHANFMQVVGPEVPFSGTQCCEPNSADNICSSQRSYREALISLFSRAVDDGKKLEEFYFSLPANLNPSARAAFRTIGHTTPEDIAADIASLKRLADDVSELLEALPIKLNPVANRALVHLIDAYQFKLTRD